MNTADVEKIVNAVLYEGYLLYPYRRCVKNIKRWMFGCVYPQAFSTNGSDTESSTMQTQCLLQTQHLPEGEREAAIEIQVRFLHLLERKVAVSRPQSGEVKFVDSLEIDGTLHESWQEAEERRIDTGLHTIDELVRRPKRIGFSFPKIEKHEPLGLLSDGLQAEVIRQQRAIEGVVELSAQELANDLFRLTVKIENQSTCDEDCKDTDWAQLRSFVSTHTILHVEGGGFVSSIDPPEDLREQVAELKNQGTWPVLVGAAGMRDTVLSSPIILYDYPQVAAESPGDLFDATEIDEILALRVMTLTDEEKRQMRGADDRAEQILKRTESLPEDQFRKLHGAIRGLKRLLPVER